jgi:hypothetical protein
MNIFVLHENTSIASEWSVDKHVVKMPLETAQMLCTAHHKVNADADTPYKATHKNHPCNLWLVESIENYRWLVSLGLSLCNEYSYRYGKIHKCQEVIEWCKVNEPQLPQTNKTEYATAMPDEYKIPNNPILSYRNYYINAKKHIHQWKKRETPQWIVGTLS